MHAMLRALALLTLSAGCQKTAPQPAPATGPSGSFTLLTINDVYRIEGVEGSGGLDRLRTLRAELEAEDPELMLLHGGDALYPSLMSRSFGGAQMIDVLNRLDGAPGVEDPRMLVVFGNHEFDKDDLDDAAALDARIGESEFRWLQGNVRFGGGADGAPLIEDPEHLVPAALETLGGIRVGFFGLTLASAGADYIDGIDDPIASARAATAALRGEGADVVVALTHRDMSADLDLTRALGPDGPDLTIGGHDHNRMAECAEGSDGVCRWVIKADADAISAAIVRVTLDARGAVRVEHEHRGLGPELPARDAAVQERIAWWAEEHDRVFCEEEGEAPGCLSAALGLTRVALIAEEMEIRRYETNLGDWIGDQMLDAYRAQGAQIALLNSGSLRLNHDIPSGATITRRHVEQLFQYTTPLRLVEIDGATLQQIVERSVEEWTGSGHWLQIAGFAYVHDPKGGTASGLTLLGADGARPIAPDETILAVVGDYLVNPEIGDQDGYEMLKPEAVLAEVPEIELKQLVIERLHAAGEDGIAPELEGRICNLARKGAPCVAIR